MRCLNKRGRESWDRAEQNTLYKKEFPPRVGGGNFRQNGNAMTRAERVGAPIEIIVVVVVVVVVVVTVGFRWGALPPRIHPLCTGLTASDRINHH